MHLFRQLSQLARRPSRHLISRKHLQTSTRLLPSIRFGSTIPCSITQDDDDDDVFFKYTTGRWLWGEKEQLKERYRRFNVQGLKDVTAQTLGSQRCVAMSKIGEGNYNKVFRLRMDDGATAMARIPHPNAGPPRYTTASEVATMEFAQSVLDIPVPKVLAWSATTDNPVGCEYIIMEEAKGTQLTEIWEDLKMAEKQTIIEDIVALEHKLLSVSFDLLGSIYFKNDNIPGCQAAEAFGDIPEPMKEDIKNRFVIGPVTIRDFWEKERSQMLIDRGPWKSTKDYVEAIAHREIAWISEYSQPSAAAPGYVRLSELQKSPQEHIQLLRKYLASISQILPGNPDLVRPTLWHPDIHDGNLFVHEGKISSVIDWQSTWVGPLILQARTPRLIDYNGEITLQLPSNYKELDREEKDRVTDQVSRSIQVYLYEEQTVKSNPLLNEAIRQPHGKMLSELVNFAGNSWDDDFIPLRECLINLERDWSEIGSRAPCPFHFSAEEIAQHRKDGEGFNETKDFWQMLEGKVDASGYTTHENFADAVEYFSRLREMGLDSLEGDERAEFEEETRWILDHHTTTQPKSNSV